MYNLFKLQKHDVFYKSREGGKSSIKGFNAENAMPCHTTKVVEDRFLTFVHGWMDGWTHRHTR